MLGLLIGTLCAAMLLGIMGWVAWNVVNDVLRIGLVEQHLTMPAPRCPEWVRFGGKRINCQGSVGHEGECW